MSMPLMDCTMSEKTPLRLYVDCLVVILILVLKLKHFDTCCGMMQTKTPLVGGAV